MNNSRGRIRRTLRPSSVAAIAGTCVGIGVSIGVAFAITVAPERPPGMLAPEPSPTEYPIGSESTRDERDVQVRVVRGTAQAQRTSVDRGTVTASRCVPGVPLSSGSWTFAIDGVPRPNLGAAAPFWRDLKRGDVGDDVRAIQIELKRLGYMVRQDGLYGRETADALQKLLQRNGAVKGESTAGHRDVADFRRSDWIWIQSPETVASRCDVSAGTPVSENDTLATLEAGVRSVAVASMPEDLIEGPRTLRIGTETVPVDENGEVPLNLAAVLTIRADDDSNLSASSDNGSTPPSPDPVEGERTVQAVLQLSEPRTLWSVPASLLFGFTGDDGACLRTDRSVLPVRIVASRLGSSLVLSEKGDIGSTAHVPGKIESTCA